MPEVRASGTASTPLRRGLHVLGACALTVLLAAPALAEIPQERAAELEHLVIQDCGSCHGLTMKGGLGRPLTPEALAEAEPEGLALIILDGIPGTAMPPWRPILTEDEALWIAAWLKMETPR